MNRVAANKHNIASGGETVMPIDSRLYESMDLLKLDMPVTMKRYRMEPESGRNGFCCHWHDKIELLYFTGGKAVIRCNSSDYEAGPGDLIVVNNNELHQGTCAGAFAEYFCIIFDPLLLEGRRSDACETKYIGPIAQNRILFQNRVSGDPEVGLYVRRLLREYEEKKTGYEIAVKATVYELILHLLRHCVRQELTPPECDSRARNLRRLSGVLEYVETHYAEKITIDGLSGMAGVSRYYFCRLFKSVTGATLSEYLNVLRVGKAEAMLQSGSGNVTEAALACGFDDPNYFSRMFRRYKYRSPSSVRNGKGEPAY